MNTDKPKKALRNLFSKTEPTIETAELEKDSHFYTESKQEEKTFSPQNNMTTQLESPIIRPFLGAQVQNSLPENSNPRVVPKIEKITSETTEKIQPKTDPISNPDAVKSVAISNDNPIAVKSEGNSAPYSFVKIQYNLDVFKAERGGWQEQDYISFINRIDQAQTDAFFLKGRLVTEVKERFYVDNKRGWALFCEETLNMNYTTANQYIRVSQEFDVTSHQKKNFGFEHFKALLPLSKEERSELLEHTPENVSVKSLRDIVAKKLQNASINSTNKETLTSKNIVETLQKLKLQLNRLKNITLSQEEKWQLFGAFQNLSDEMKTISNSFITHAELKNEGSFTNSGT